VWGPCFYILSQVALTWQGFPQVQLCPQGDVTCSTYVVQAKAPYDIPELQKRLIPCGAYVPRKIIRDYRDQYLCDEDYGSSDSESLNDALDTRLHIGSFPEGQIFLDFLPLPVPYIGHSNLPARVFPVTVISTDGGTKPIMFGLIIAKVLPSGLSFGLNPSTQQRSRGYFKKSRACCEKRFMKELP